MRFVEQNKKKIDPRYFLNEEVKIPPLSSIKPEETIERGVVKKCPGAREVQVLLVKSYPSYEQFMASKEPDPLRVRKKLTDGIIGQYFTAAINSIIRNTTGELTPQRNDISSGYEYNKTGYEAVCRDIAGIKSVVETFLMLKAVPSSSEPSQEPIDADMDVKAAAETPKVTGTDSSSQFPQSVPRETSKTRSVNDTPKEGDTFKSEKTGVLVWHNGKYIPKEEYDQLKSQGKLEESKARDASYNALKEQKNKKLFEALIKG